MFRDDALLVDNSCRPVLWQAHNPFGRRFWHISIHEDGDNHQARPGGKKPVYFKAEKIDRRNGGKDDGEWRGETLENVIRVLHHQGHDKAPEALHENDGPHRGGIAEKEALGADGVAVRGEAREQAHGDGVEAELDVAEPQGDLGALEDLLEVDAGEAGHEGGDEDGAESEEGALDVEAGLAGLRALLIQLHHGDACETPEGKTLECKKTPND